MEELKPCPFCGGEADVSQLPENPGDLRSMMFVVGCDGVNGSLCPGCKYKLSPFYTTKKLAIEMWNNRATI